MIQSVGFMYNEYYKNNIAYGSEDFKRYVFTRSSSHR